MNIAITATVPAQGRCRVHGIIGAGAPLGLCARCLILGGMKEDDAPVSDRLPIRFGDYELLAQLGKGGMGVVYRARHVGLGHEVALKRISDGELADEAARRRFWEEARIVSRLRHSNIVPIHDVREHDGQPYFTMDLMSGGTLEDALESFRDPRRAATLVAKLARAAHAYHRKGIIHRDLKPVNILFHETPDEPYIADFGVAKHLDEGGATLTNAFVGTAPYMGPEQRPTHPKRDTPAADVWSLGVILYELLAGRRPFSGPTFLEVLRSAEEDEPELLYRVRREIGRDLAAVCHMCLRKEPERRYLSAEALAEDLERCLRHEPVLARCPGRAERVLRWCRRHPTASLLLGSAAAALVGLTLWAFAMAQAQAQARRDEVLATNAYAARAVAGAVLAQLDEYAGWVAKEAGDARLAAALAAGDDVALRALSDAVEARHRDVLSPLTRWFVLDSAGWVRAYAPWPPRGSITDRSYAFRDYFGGAMTLSAGADRPVHISRGFKATDDRYKVAISSPIRGERGAIAGVLVASIDTNSRFGALALSDDRRIAALAVRRDRAAAGEPLPEDYILLVHDGVQLGEGVVVQSAALRRLARRRDDMGAALRDPLRLPPPEWVEIDDDYADPLLERAPGGARGPWLAGVALVGNTDLAVIVQTRLDAATALDRTPLRVLAAWSAGGAALLVAVLFAVLRRPPRSRS